MVIALGIGGLFLLERPAAIESQKDDLSAPIAEPKGRTRMSGSMSPPAAERPTQVTQVLPALRPGPARLVEELVFQGVAEVLECEVDLTGQHVPHTYDSLRQDGADLSRMTVPIGVRTLITVDASGTPIHRLSWDEPGSACTVDELPQPRVQIRLMQADGEPYVGPLEVCGSKVQTDGDGAVALDDVRVDRVERGPRSVVTGCSLRAPGLAPQLVPVHGSQVAFQLPSADAAQSLALDGAAGGPDEPVDTPPNYTPSEGLQVILDNQDLEPEIKQLALELLEGTSP